MQFKCLEKATCHGVSSHHIFTSFILWMQCKKICLIHITTSFVFKLGLLQSLIFSFLHKLSPLGTVRCCLLELMVGGVSHATLPPCSSVLVCPCLACPPLNLPPAVSFLRASSSEPKQQFHLFCQGWECTQPSLAVFLPAPLDAKPVDLTHMPALPFLLLSFTLSAGVCDSANV